MARSSRTPVSAAAGKKITTIEGLAANGKLSRMQEAFVVEGAMQCGYCVPGMILTATAFLEKTPHPTEAQPGPAAAEPLVAGAADVAAEAEVDVGAPDFAGLPDDAPDGEASLLPQPRASAGMIQANVRAVVGNSMPAQAAPVDAGSVGSKDRVGCRG